MFSCTILCRVHMEMNHWTGVFESDMYDKGYVNGTLDVDLPNVVKSDLSSSVTMKYDGTFNNGNNVTVKMDNGKGVNGNQKISFSCTSITDACVSGTYSTTLPDDNGTFQLNKVVRSV